MSKRHRHGVKPLPCPKCGSTNINFPDKETIEIIKRGKYPWISVKCQDCQFGIVDLTLSGAMWQWNSKERIVKEQNEN